MVLGDVVTFASERNLLVDEDRSVIGSILDSGVMRRSTDYLRGLITV